MIKKIVVVTVVWLIFASCFFVGSVVALDGVKYFHLAKVGTEAKGTVTAKEPDNHLFIRYSYQVNGQAHQGIGSAGRGNPSFEDLKLGDPVRVYYDPDNPDLSLLRDPSQHFKSIANGVIFVTLLGPSFCLLGLYAKGWLPGFGRSG